MLQKRDVSRRNNVNNLKTDLELTLRGGLVWKRGVLSLHGKVES